MKRITKLLVLTLITIGITSCATGQKEETGSQEKAPSVITKRRSDGTLSSINPVDDKGYVHGVKVNYYEDGKTVHSKITFEHGRKQGSALWYYKNGQVYEHTSFDFGRKQGVTKKYYKTGELMEEITYDQGEVQPGRKKYNRQGKEI